MKTSLSTHSLKKMMETTGMNYLQACDLVKKLGYDGIEFVGLRLELQPESDLLTLAGKIRAHCEDIGLPVACYTTSPDPLQFPKEDLMEQADIASALGAPVMRHNACRACPEGMTWRDVIRKIAPDIRAVTEYAAERHVRTCVENHGRVIQDADRMEELMLAVRHENFGWLIDLGNFLGVDDNPLRAVPIAAPYAFHVHVKDLLQKPCDSFFPGAEWRRSRNGTFLRGTMAGHGVVPIPVCLKMLHESGYNSFVSYEYEGKEETMFALECGADYLKRAIIYAESE